MIKGKIPETLSYDVVIIGGGITGLSLANQIIEQKITKKLQL